MPWDGSTRRSQLPPDWATIRNRILDRDGHRCTATRRDGQRCTERTRLEVDHIDNPHDHDEANLRTLCHWHHAQRTALQAQAARTPPTQRRPPEPHPGLR